MNTQNASAPRPSEQHDAHSQNPRRPGWCACGRAYPCPQLYTETEQDEILSHVLTMLRIRAQRRSSTRTQ